MCTWIFTHSGVEVRLIQNEILQLNGLLWREETNKFPKLDWFYAGMYMYTNWLWSEKICYLLIFFPISCRCGKLLKSELDAQAHAARTQHASFSESVEEIKPLTEEEKAEQKEKYESIPSHCTIQKHCCRCELCVITKGLCQWPYNQSRVVRHIRPSVSLAYANADRAWTCLA